MVGKFNRPHLVPKPLVRSEIILGPTVNALECLAKTIHPITKGLSTERT
jgi:hypothetical protein